MIRALQTKVAILHHHDATAIGAMVCSHAHVCTRLRTPSPSNLPLHISLGGRFQKLDRRVSKSWRSCSDGKYGVHCDPKD